MMATHYIIRAFPRPPPPPRPTPVKDLASTRSWSLGKAFLILGLCRALEKEISFCEWPWNILGVKCCGILFEGVLHLFICGIFV